MQEALGGPGVNPLGAGLWDELEGPERERERGWVCPGAGSELFINYCRNSSMFKTHVATLVPNECQARFYRILNIFFCP